MAIARTIEDMVAEINRRGWTVLNLFQWGKGQPKMTWRCNLQRWTTNGASEMYFTEFADADNMRDAVAAALRDVVDRKEKSSKTATLTAGQNAKVVAAMDRMLGAVRDDGT